MKTLNKVKMSIWINALNCNSDRYIILINPRIFSNYYNTCWYYYYFLQELLIFIYYFSGWLDIYFMKNTLLSGILKCVLGIFVLTHISMMTTFFFLIFLVYISLLVPSIVLKLIPLLNQWLVIL